MSMDGVDDEEREVPRDEEAFGVALEPPAVELLALEDEPIFVNDSITWRLVVAG